MKKKIKKKRLDKDKKKSKYEKHLSETFSQSFYDPKCSSNIFTLKLVA